MYEYLLERLINKPQVYTNLRRTAKEGLISKIDRIQLSELALKYFGVDENGDYTNDKEQIAAYKCPYSGKIIKDPNTVALDHIIPFVNGGGTVLFNCIPIDSMSNHSKNASSLLKWWTIQDYFSIDKIQRLLDYIFEAYTLTFKEYSVEELENSYQDYFEELPEEYTFDSDEELTEENDVYRRREEVKKKESMTFEKMSYQQFIINIIGFLKVYDVDCSIYENKLKELEDKNIFKDIEKCELIQRTLQEYIINELGDDNRYISYSISIDINRLLKSFKTNDIVSELRERLGLIQRLLKDNNKTLKQYFENVPDIEDYNILYIENPSEVNITEFLNSLTLNHETKIDKFIEMLGIDEYTSYKDGIPDDNNVFKQNNKVSFKDYEHIEGLDTSHFWQSNSERITQQIQEKIKVLSSKEILSQEDEQELEKLNKANKAIDNYNFYNPSNMILKIDKFIEMASMDKYTNYVDGWPDDNNIFRARNKVPFKNYEHIEGLNTSYFWNNRADRIVKRIQERQDLLSTKEVLTREETQELEQLNKANKAIEDYVFYNPNNMDLRIDKFIEMAAMKEYTSYKDGNPDDNNIFKEKNKASFKNYDQIEGLTTSSFWLTNSDRIVRRIKEKQDLLLSKEVLTKEEAQELDLLNRANKAIEDYKFANSFNMALRIDKFIEMLSMDEYTSYKDGKPNDKNIFKVDNKVPFEGYDHITGLTTSYFWTDNADRVLQRIKEKQEILSQKEKITQEEAQELEKLNKASKAIDDYNFYNPKNLDIRIDKFIEMLSMDEYTSYKDGRTDDKNIFKVDNKVPFEGYDHITGLTTSYFWTDNADRVLQRIKEKQELLTNKEILTQSEEQELERLNKANKAIDNYKFVNHLNMDLKIDKFIEMLSMDEYTNYIDGSPDEKNIFNQRNTVSFKDYNNIEGFSIGPFWIDNSERIVQRINEKQEILTNKETLTQEDKEELERLNKATKAIDDFNFYNPFNMDLKIDKFIEMLSMKEYTSYRDGKPDDNNIFKTDPEKPVSFKDYDHITGLTTSYFWGNNGEKIIQRIKEKQELLTNKELLTQEEEQELEKLNKANKAINDYNFYNKRNLNLKIDKFIEMINLKKYTDYKDGKPDNNNIFCKNNKIEFEGYGDITGLTTSGFWQGNSTKYIIPRLFFSDEYSDTKFDNARKNVMTYINYVRKTRKQNELNSINEYIETLNSKKKEVQDLIKLRDELLFKEKELVLLNNELKNNEMVNMRAV